MPSEGKSGKPKPNKFKQKTNDTERQLLRLLKLVNRAGARFECVETGYIIHSSDRNHRFCDKTVERGFEMGLLEIASGIIVITQTGRSFLARALHPENPFIAQHGIYDRPVSEKNLPGQSGTNVQSHETPLYRLFARRDKNGKTWLNESEYRAAECIQTDFERAGLQPNISANWGLSVAGRGRSVNGKAEISDFCLDARHRLNRALEAIGPELCGIVLDICCFQKGLEIVEKERQWPARSAKLMLKTGLAILVRHYGLETGKTASSLRQWGSGDHRPVV